MNQTSFQVGDRVRHKVTQIEGEIVQMEESLAMPHAWVTEPSVCEFNPPKLYRIVDLEKVEDSGEGAEKTNQAQGVNPNISLSDREAKRDSLTSNDFSGESVLTVEPELITLCCESVSGEQIVSKPLPISVRSSSSSVGNNSTSNELLRDISSSQTNISLSKNGSEAGDDLTSNELLRDKSSSQTNISRGKNHSSAEDDLTSNELLRDKSSSQTNISRGKNGSEPEDNLTSNELLRDISSSQTNISLSKKEVGREDDLTPKQLPSDQGTDQADLSPSKSRRYKGQGSGTISWRTLTRNGRDYHQPWYQYEFWDKGKCTLKSSKYIPKKLLQQVQQMNQAKVPVLEILEVLGVFEK